MYQICSLKVQLVLVNLSCLFGKNIQYKYQSISLPKVFYILKTFINMYVKRMFISLYYNCLLMNELHK